MVRDLKMEQTLYLDLETTDKLNKESKEMPSIIEFAVYHQHDKRFRSMVTPKDPNFTIAEGAAAVHRWTKEKLLALPEYERPTFDVVWKNFLKWLREETTINMDHNVFLCAYNGLGFDFRLIVHDLKSYNLPFAQRWVLVDPWFDMVCLEKRCLKLDEAYKDISKYSNTRN